MKLENLPSTCACGKGFDIAHALSCKKGGFVNERHDNIKNLLTRLLAKVCHDVVESEPHLIPVSGETFQLKTANTQDEARLDIKAKSTLFQTYILCRVWWSVTGKAKSFWQHGQTAYFDVRVTHVNAASQLSDDKTQRKLSGSTNRQKRERIPAKDFGH